MMAVLPGIDANDEQKTLVAFRFFCIVLSSVGELSVRAPRPHPLRSSGDSPEAWARVRALTRLVLRWCAAPSVLQSWRSWQVAPGPHLA
jgi:hypothetical protein